MALNGGPSDITVSVHAGFDEDGVWLIDARLEVPWNLSALERARLLGEGQIALAQKILREVHCGHSFGARVVRVEIATDDSITVLMGVPWSDMDDGLPE